jgi:gas vesicle structural protein
MSNELLEQQDVTLLDLLDRLLNKGIVISGDLMISVANVDLIYVGLRLVVTAVETMNRYYES